MKAWKVVLWSFVAFVAVILAQLPFSTSRGADYTRSQDVVTSVDGPKAAVDKLELEDIAIYAILNKLKDANASTTAPSSPNEGEFWFDTGNSALKQYYASTWTTVWSYADTTTVNWKGEINSIGGTISNLQADTLTANYGTITDADIGSATINTLAVGDITATTGSIDTLTTGSLTINNQPYAYVVGSVASTQVISSGAYTIIKWTTINEQSGIDYNTTTGLTTVTNPGTYAINAHVVASFASTFTDTNGPFIQSRVANGSTIRSRFIGSSVNDLTFLSSRVFEVNTVARIGTEDTLSFILNAAGASTITLNYTNMQLFDWLTIKLLP